jgi:hypothetical protein
MPNRLNGEARTEGRDTTSWGILVPIIVEPTTETAGESNSTAYRSGANYLRVMMLPRWCCHDAHPMPARRPIAGRSYRQP